MQPDPYAAMDLGVSNLPMWFFVVVHTALLIVGLVLAARSFKRWPERSTIGTGFILYAVSEVLFLLYHFNVTTFLLSHTLAEVVNVIALLLIFTGITQAAATNRSARTGQTLRA